MPQKPEQKQASDAERATRQAQQAARVTKEEGRPPNPKTEVGRKPSEVPQDPLDQTRGAHWVGLLMANCHKRKDTPDLNARQFPWACWVTGNIGDDDNRMQRVVCLIPAGSSKAAMEQVNRCWNIEDYTFRFDDRKSWRWRPDTKMMYRNNGDGDQLAGK